MAFFPPNPLTIFAGYLSCRAIVLVYRLYKDDIETKQQFWRLVLPFGNTIVDIIEYYNSLKMKNELTEIDIKDYWHYGALKPCRINTKLAKELLARNASFVKDGQTYYYKLVNLGLGVYEITPIHMAQLSSTRVFKD